MVSKQETKLSNLQAMAEWALRNSLAIKVGRGKYAMAEYEKIKRITFTLNSDHLLLELEMDTEHMKVIDSILKQLGK